MTIYAIIETGGKQYKVSHNDIIKTEKISGEVGDMVEFNDILLLRSGEDFLIEDDDLTKVVVKGRIISQERDRKVVVFKFKRRKNYKKKQGHRQPITRILIKEILKGKKLLTPKDTPKKSTKKVEKVEVEKAEIKEEKPKEAEVTKETKKEEVKATKEAPKKKKTETATKAKPKKVEKKEKAEKVEAKKTETKEPKAEQTKEKTPKEKKAKKTDDITEESKDVKDEGKEE